MKARKIYIILFIGLFLALFAASRFLGPFFLFNLFGQLANKIKGSSVHTLTAASESGSMELTVFSGQKNLSLTAIEKSKWPKGTIGGLYKIEPSGEFDGPVKVRMTFNDDPGPFFSIGYWNPDTKKWEWVPTVKTAPKVYETMLFHASEVGGAQNPSYAPRFQDPKNQAMVNDLLSYLEKEMAKNKNVAADIQEAWDKMKQLSDKLIGDFCGALKGKESEEFFKSSRPIITDLLAGWELSQYLGFTSFKSGFQDAVYSGFTNERGFKLDDKRECRKEEIIPIYTIDQIDDYETNVNLNLAQGMYKANSKSKTRVVSGGATLIKSSDWKTSWKVLQSYRTYSNVNQKFYKESSSELSYALMDIGNYDLGVESTDLMMLTFNLAGLKKGDTFPIKEERVAAYDSRTGLGDPPLKGVMILKDNGLYILKLNEKRDMYSVETIDPGLTRELTGVLLADHGSEGGLIGFKKESIFTSEQLQQFQQAMKGAPKELLNLYDAQGNPTFVTGDLDRKALLITKEK